MEKTLPNAITLTRFILIFIIAACLVVATPVALWAAAILFILSAATDWLDGYLARKLDQVSEWGIAMDPIGDKIQVVLTLFVLAHMGAFSTLGLVAGFLIILREIMVSGLREYFQKKNIDTPVTRLAKWKTATQLTALSVFLVGLASMSSVTAWVGEGLLGFAALLTVITGWEYYASGMKAVHRPKSKSKK